MNRQIRQTVLPLIAAIIWGTAFAFQSMSTDYIEPFTFVSARGIIATIALIPVWMGARHLEKKRGVAPTRQNPRTLLKGGLCCGTILTISATLQQAGISETSAGKTAFITALYIVIVPLAGLFFGRRVSPTIWLSVIIAVTGLYFLCITEDFSVSGSDLVVLLCAFGFAAHILVVDHFISLCDGIALSCAQFAVEAVLGGIGALLFEHPNWENIWMCMGSLLYVGVFSSAVGFTLQIIAQKDSNPTVVSILLSLESLFGAISGAVILHESMSAKEVIGCVLMLVAVMLTQIPERKKDACPESV